MSIKDLTLGRGELWLNLFNAGTYVGAGERYLGNTPGFTLTARETAVERKGSSKGKRHIAERHVTEREYTETIICDEIAKLNLALWLGSTSAEQSVAATGGGPVISEIFTVNREYGYQLGKSVNPLGHRNIINVVMKKGVTPITQANNVVLDAARGRFVVLKDAPDLPNGTALTVEYKTSGYQRTNVSPLKELRGELRYLAYNAHGRNYDMFFPLVSIEPSGALDLKTADWQRLQFTMTVMKRPGFEMFYVGSVD